MGTAVGIASRARRGGHGARRGRASVLDGPALRRPAALDRDPPARRAALLGEQPEQGLRSGAASGCRSPAYLVAVHGATGVHELAEKGEGVRLLHRPARLALRDQRRHLRARVALRHAAREHGADRPRRACSRADRDDRRLGAARSGRCCGRTHARGEEGPRRRLLHLRRVELRRPADAARRSAALPRLPEGRAVRVDPSALWPQWLLRERDPARHLQRLGPASSRPRGAGTPRLAARGGDEARAAPASRAPSTSSSWRASSR